MAPKRKRGPTLEVAGGPTPPSPPSLLDQIRNMEEFASLGQYLFMFGTGALKLPDFGREELETELLTPQSALVEQIRLALIKMVTANPRLAMEQFDEQARKQFTINKPEMNPFGEEGHARPFWDMDLFTKIRVLHQLSVWTFAYPHLMREKMGDVDPQEELSWRMDHCGYDRHENIYYILDDNRLYRRSPSREAPEPPRKKTQSKQPKGRKRRRVSTAAEESDGSTPINGADEGMKWSCICITLREWEPFVAGLKGSKDEDESALYKYLDREVLPEIRRAEGLKQKKLLDLEKEQQKIEAVANRKRSSRIGERMARRKEEEKSAVEVRIQEDLLRKAQAGERKKYQEREARLAARERQNKERERRSQAQDAGSSALSCGSSASDRRASTRVQTRVSQRSQRSQSNEDTDWMFDCRCGIHGIQYEDGSKIIACDKCDIWQHLACQNLPTSFTEGDFACERCRRREAHAQAQAADGPRVTIKLRIGPRDKISPINPPQNQDRNASHDREQINARESQVSGQNEPRHEMFGHGDRESEDAVQDSTTNRSLSGSVQAKVNGDANCSARERSAQASADFLLLMADPGHITPSSSQQPGNGASLPNGDLNPVPASFIPSSTADQLSPPEKSLNLSLFVDNPNPIAISLSGNNDAHPYRETPYARNMIAGPATSANA